jgi:hypothetical protein
VSETTLSHLSGLNGRPTVYESVDLLSKLREITDEDRDAKVALVNGFTRGSVRVDWFRPDESAGLLGLSVAEFFGLVKAGHLARYSPLQGGRYRAVDLVRLLAETRPADPEPPAELPMEEVFGPVPQHLYAVEIFGVGTKIGISTKPTQRIKNHISAARAHLRRVGRCWVSVSHVEAVDNETQLRIWGMSLRRGMREYLLKTFDQVMERIAELPMTPRACGRLLSRAERYGTALQGGAA